MPCNEIKYIAETKVFVIDGVVIKESDLTPSQVEEYKLVAKKWQMILGEHGNGGQGMVIL